jgi:D-alanyl-D-alanine carboxypeptidase
MNSQFSILNSQLVVLLSFVCLSCAPVADLDRGLEEAGLEADAEWLRQEISVPGLVLAVLEPGEEALIAAAGFADLEERQPMTIGARFVVGEVTMSFFAVILLMLADEGVLSLEDTLDGYLDWPRGDEIRIHMLLRQTSGIPPYVHGSMEGRVGGGRPEIFRRRHEPSEVLDGIRSQALLFEPGTQQAASNTNGLLLGAVLERAAGKSLETLLEERIVAPLGLESTGLPGSQAPPVPGFRRVPSWGLGQDLVDVTFAQNALSGFADGGVASTALDLLRYHQALRGGELLGEGAWAEMRRVEPGFRNGLAYLMGDSALGAFEGHVGRSVGHSAVSYFHLQTGLYAVLLTNRGDGPLALNAFLERRYGSSFLSGG